MYINGYIIQTESQQGNNNLEGNLDQRNLIDTYRTFHLKGAEYTFFLSAHARRIDHILGDQE